MDLNHLHLHVRDVQRAMRFYVTWFGFAERAASDEVHFIANERGFLLALVEDPEPQRLPAWFHFGFGLASAGEVRALHARMVAGGVPMAKPLLDEPGFVAFRCRDADGYPVEVYWE
ncbi:MAG: VOC family protein [Planctomycetes bacterium]|nr:VOC family protein [Planctomycetota bacterium]